MFKTSTTIYLKDSHSMCIGYGVRKPNFFEKCINVTVKVAAILTIAAVCL